MTIPSSGRGGHPVPLSTAGGSRQTVTLPYPPGVNAWLRVHNGRPILSARAREFKDTAAKLAMVAGMRPYVGDVSVTLQLYRPRKVGDCDGPAKLVLDALQGLAYLDDKQVCRLLIERHDDRTNPRVEVTVEEVADGRAA